MSNLIFRQAVLLLLFACFSCSDAPVEEKEDANLLGNEADTSLLNGYGTLERLEVADWPMAFIVVEFPDQNKSQVFDINFERLKGAGLQELEGHIGQNIHIRFTDEWINQLKDIQIKGESVLREFAPDFNPQWEKISGKLVLEKSLHDEQKGAIVIRSKRGNSLRLPAFITEEIKQVQNKKVDLFYLKQPKLWAREVYLGRE